MANEDTTQIEFYAPWPNLGKKFSQQLGEIRTDTAALAPLVRGMGLDSDGDFTSLDGVEKTVIQSREWGKHQFHNKFRIHYDKTNDLLDIAYNTGTEVAPNWYTTWTIDNDGHVSQQNTPTTASNQGTGTGVFKQKSGVDLEFKSLRAFYPLSIREQSNTIDFHTGAERNTYSTLAPSVPVGGPGGVEAIISAAGKSGVDFPFKAIEAGPNMVISTAGDGQTIVLQSTAQVVEFYGIVVQHTDGSAIFPGVHILKVDPAAFYLVAPASGRSAETILGFRGETLSSSSFVAVIGDNMTGPLLQADGSVSAPSFAFTDDVDTGLFLNAVADLAITVAGSSRLRILDTAILALEPIQATSAGSVGAPDYAFFSNTTTGLYQLSANDESIAFASGGVAAGAIINNSDAPVMRMPQGTKTTPQYSFTADTDTGVYLPSAGNLGFSVGDTNRLNLSGSLATFTEPIQGPSGSITSGDIPFSFTSDPDIGMYRKTTNQLGFVTNATLAGYFDASQNLFVVGNVNVTGRVLADEASAAAPSFDVSDGGAVLGIYRNSAASGSLGFAVQGSDAGHIRFSSSKGQIWTDRHIATDDGSRSNPAFSYGDAGQTGMYRDAATDSVRISASNVFVAEFDSVGIRLAQPVLVLDVTGDIEAGGNIHAIGDVATTDEVYGGNWDGSSNVPTKNAVYDKIESLDLDNNFDTLTVAGWGTFGGPVRAEAFYLGYHNAGISIDTNSDLQLDAGSNSVVTPNNFGIGDGSPGVLLHVQSAVDVADSTIFILKAPASVGVNHLDTVFHNINANSANRQVRLAFRHGSFGAGDLDGGVGGYIDSGRDNYAGGDAGKYNDAGTSDSDLRFATALNNSNVERMRITSAGNVGIGTESPEALLDVRGDALVLNDLKAGRIHAGPSFFYAPKSGTGGVPAIEFHEKMLGGHVNLTDNTHVVYGFRGSTDSEGSGMAFNHSSNGLNILKSSARKMGFFATSVQMFEELRLQSGTATDPSLNFNDDSNTGIYRTSGDPSGVIRFSSDAAEVAHFNATGLHIVDVVQADKGDFATSMNAPTGVFYSAVDIGSDGPGDSIIEFLDQGTLKYTVGHDTSRSALILTSGTLDDTNDEIVIQPDCVTIDKLKGGDIEFGTATFYTQLNTDQLFLDRLGSTADVAIRFTADPNTGIYSPGSDQISFVAGGGANFRITNSYVFVADVPLSLRATAGPTTPDLRWAHDVDTGISQNVQADNSLAFITGGTRAGHFDSSQNLHVTNDLKAGRIHSGPAVFYIQDPSTSSIVVARGTGATPAIVSDQNPNTGIYWSTSDSVILASNGGAKVQATNSYIRMWDELRLSDGSLSDPQLIFQGDTNTGLFFRGADQWAWATGGVEAGYFDANQNLHVTNDILAGGDMVIQGEYHTPKVVAGTGEFYERLYIPDGTVSEPGLSFLQDTDSGIYRLSDNVWRFVSGGSAKMEITNTTVRMYDELNLVPGTLAKPALTWAADQDTGLRQRVSADNSVEFVTGGVSAGYFDSDQNLHVTQEVQAAKVVTGYGVFYGSIRMGTANAGFNTQGQIFAGGDFSHPGYSWVGDENTGIYHSTGGDKMFFRCGGSTVFTVDSGVAQLSKVLRLDINSGLPPDGAFTGALVWHDKDTTGVYQPEGVNTDSWGWSIAQTYVGKFGADKNFHVERDVKAGRVEAGTGVFYVGLAIPAGKPSVDRPGLYFKDDPTTGIYQSSSGKLSFIAAGTPGGTFNNLGNLTTSGKVYANAGTISAATYSWSGDANTGMFQHAADHIGFTTDGTEAGFFDAQQNLHVTNTVKSDRVLSQYGTFYGLEFNGSDFKMVDGILYAYDTTRNKYLSIDRATFQYGRDLSGGGSGTNLIIGPAGTVVDGSFDSGNPMPRNATVTHIMAQIRNVANDAAHFDINTIDQTAGSGRTEIHTFTVPVDTDRIVYNSGALDIDVDQDLSLQSVFDGTASTAIISDPIITIEVAWRTT